MSYLFAQADATRIPLADQSVDAVISSPPYLDARSYGIGAQRDAERWAAWMLDVTREALRVSRGPVLWVCSGVVRGGEYQPGPELLIAEAYRDGLTVERPLIWRSNKAPSRHGVWWSCSWEYILAFKREAELPYFGWQATARPPIHGWAGAWRQRGVNGKRSKRREYRCPELASPRDVIEASVGGGHLGPAEAHENEAPYPEKLVAQLIPVLVPEGGTVLDPFSGSGTTASVAAQHGRCGIGLDLRMSQCRLGRRRTGKQLRPATYRDMDAPDDSPLFAEAKA